MSTPEIKINISLKDSIREATKQVKKLGDVIERNTEQSKKAYHGVDKAVSKVSTQVKRNSDAVKRNTSMWAKSAKAIKRSGDAYARLNSSVDETKARLGELQKVSGIVLATMTAGIGAAVYAASGFEDIGTQFKVLTGDINTANKAVEEMKEFSTVTPFQFTNIAQAGKQLLGFGYTTDQLIPKLKAIGDVAAAAGKPIDEISLIFGQVAAAAGKLTGERLLQFQERGIMLGPALAKTMGVAESSIKDLVSRGKVDLKTFEKAFESLSQKGGFAFGGMKQLSLTLSGKISTLKDNFVGLAAGIGDNFLPILKDFADTIISVTKFLSGSTVFKGFVTVILALGAALSAAVLGVASLGSALITLKIAMIAAKIGAAALGVTIKAVLISSGIGLAIVAVGYLVKKIFDWREESKKAKEANEKLTESFKFQQMEINKGLGVLEKHKVKSKTVKNNTLEWVDSLSLATSGVKKYNKTTLNMIDVLGDVEKVAKKTKEIKLIEFNQTEFDQMIDEIKNIGKTQLEIIDEEHKKRIAMLDAAHARGAEGVKTEKQYSDLRVKLEKSTIAKKEALQIASIKKIIDIESNLRSVVTPVEKAESDYRKNVENIQKLKASPEVKNDLLLKAEQSKQKRLSQIAINQERTTQEAIAKIRKTYQKTTRLQSSQESHAQEKELIAKQLQSGEITQSQAKKREAENDKALAERRLDIELEAQKQIEKGLKGIQDRQASTLNQYTNIGTAMTQGFDFSQDKGILDQERTLSKKLESGEISQEQFEFEKESLNKAQKDLETSSKIGFGAGLLISVAKGADGAKDMLLGASTAALDMFIPGLGQAAGPLLDVFMQGPEATKKMVKDFTGAIPELVTSIVEAAPAFIEELINQLPIMIQKLIDSVPALIDGLIASIPRLIDGLVEAVPKIVLAIVDFFAFKAHEIGLSITFGLIKALPRVMTMFPKMGIAIVKGMVKKLGSVGSIFKKLFSFSGGKGKVEKFIHLDFPAVKFAQGGLVGNRSFTRDSESHDKVPSMLSVGEVVLPKSIVNSGNIEELIIFMKKIGLSFQNFGFGGFVKKVKNKAKGAISSVSDSLSGDFNFAKNSFKKLIDGDISGLLGGFADNFFNKMDMVKGLMPKQLRKLFDKIDPFGFIRELYESLKNIGFKLSISDIIKNPFDAIKKIIELNKQVLKPHFKKLIKPAKDEPEQAAKGGEVIGGITGVDSVPLLAQKGELVVDRGNNVKLTKFLNSSKQTTNNNNSDMSLVVELLGQVVNLLGNPITVESDVSIDRDVLAKSILQLNRNNARLTV